MAIFTCRPATEADWAFIRATAKPSVATSMRAGPRAQWEHVGGYVLEALKDQLVWHVASVTGDDATLMGWICTAPIAGVVTAQVEIGVYVRHAFRGHGVARALREAARREAA